MLAWFDDLWWSIKHRAKNAYWWFRHRLDPRHRYHVVRTGLCPGYYDPDIRLMAAIFNETSLFIERTGSLIRWNDDGHHAAAYKAFTEAAEWWKAHKDDLGDCDESDAEWQEAKRLMQAVIENLRIMWYP